MNLRIPAMAFVCFGMSACASVSAPDNDAAACLLAITNVNLITMIDDRIRPGQTVRFNHQQIIGISDALDGKGNDAGECENSVDGGGRYLLPGLNDMHTHVENEAFEQAFGQTPAPLPFDALMAAYLVNGITGMRILSGSTDLLHYRDQSAGGDKAPHMIVASPMLSASPPILPEPVTKIVDDVEAARAAVRDYATAGYDLIKIRRNLTIPIYEAVLDEAHLAGLDVDGHVTGAAALEDILAAGQDGFAHLDELAGKTPDTLSVTVLTDLLVACQCYVSTTLGVMANISAQINDYEGLVARKEMRVMFPLFTGAFWFKPNNPYLREGAPAAFFDALGQKTKDVVKPLYDAGVPLLAGSDALNPMLVPGYSMLDELDHLVDAGLSPFEALRTATIIPSETVPGFEGVGALEEGRMANAVLLADNPLEDLNALRKPEAVVLNGNFLDSAELNTRLDAAVKLISPQ